VKAKGGGSQGDRLRPTAYIRRRKRHVNEDEEHLNGKIVNDCLRDKHTTIILYQFAITYPISRIVIHLSELICK